ncbi:MAG: AMP-binding protein [Oscillospiraceae bacterium]|nr:AMP-binding protein [Oscillospiraceae bacterium]
MKPKKILYKATKFKNVKELLEFSTKKYADNTAFIIKEKKDKNINYKKITFKKFKENMDNLGTALIHLGFKDKKIAVIGKNSYEWALTFFTVLNGVGIIVPLDKGLPEEEIENSLKISHADCIFFESEYSDFMKKIMNNQNTSVKNFICMDSVNDTPFLSLSSLLNDGKKLINDGNREYIDAIIDEEKFASLIFTSGTTSLSKGVMLCHKNYTSNIYGLSSIYELYPETDINMAFLPFHHTLGLIGILFMLSNGITNVFCDGLRHIQTNLVEYKVSTFVGVPLILESMYKKIMTEVEKQGKTNLIKIMGKVCSFLLIFGIDIRRKVFKEILDNLGGHLRLVINGAAAIDKNTVTGFRNFGVFSAQGYGLTETTPVAALEHIKAVRYGSCGPALLDVEIKVDNPNQDGIGEILVKGPNVMLGYFENKEATDNVLKDGWFYSGDLGYIDKDGYLFITGRMKNVIVLKNGKNIYPEEIELLISALPYIAENMVFGSPKEDDYVLSAKIVYDKEHTKNQFGEISEEELKGLIWQDIKNINKNLPNYKHIKNIIITSEPMIKTTTSKVKRHEELGNM